MLRLWLARRKFDLGILPYFRRCDHRDLNRSDARCPAMVDALGTRMPLPAERIFPGRSSPAAGNQRPAGISLL
jgi:hypothetical protein